MRTAKVALLGDELGMPVLFRSVRRMGLHISLAAVSGRRFLKVPELLAPVPMKLVGGANGETWQEFAGNLRACEVELLICFSFDQILPAEVLAVPRLGCWNLHGGILPKHRGANALNWVLILGESQTALSFHRMTTEVDAGDILSEVWIDLPFDMDARKLQREFALAAQQLLPDGIEAILSGRPPLRQQEVPLSPPFKRRTPADGRIDWNQTDTKIYNLVRALVKPWPGAWTVDKHGEVITFDEFMTLEEIAAARALYAPSSPRNSRGSAPTSPLA